MKNLCQAVIAPLVGVYYLGDTGNSNQATLTCMLSQGVVASVLIITVAVGLQVLYETSLFLCLSGMCLCVRLGKFICEHTHKRHTQECIS